MFHKNMFVSKSVPGGVNNKMAFRLIFHAADLQSMETNQRLTWKPRINSCLSICAIPIAVYNLATNGIENGNGDSCNYQK